LDEEGDGESEDGEDNESNGFAVGEVVIHRLLPSGL
jgi:hypothetical protein